MVRHWFLVPAFGGSNPSSPAKYYIKGDRITVANPDFSFDDSGQFLLAQIYLLGAALQIDRYQEAAISQKHSKKASGLFRELHEVSCLLEDLACIAEYFKLGNFKHPKHKLWKQARHHIRHDMRDSITSESEVGQTKKRHTYLKFKPGVKSQITFDVDRFILGESEISIDEVKDYLDWANDIFQKYIDNSRSTGHLRDK